MVCGKASQNNPHYTNSFHHAKQERFSSVQNVALRWCKYSQRLTQWQHISAGERGETIISGCGTRKSNLMGLHPQTHIKAVKNSHCNHWYIFGKSKKKIGQPVGNAHRHGMNTSNYTNCNLSSGLNQELWSFRAAIVLAGPQCCCRKTVVYNNDRWTRQIMLNLNLKY